MTKSRNKKNDLLGSPLPGFILLPAFKVWREQRGKLGVLAWRRAASPAAPASSEIAQAFISLPRPIPKAIIGRGKERVLQRQKLIESAEASEPSYEELLASFSITGRANFARQIPDGPPPFFGGYGVLDDFIKLADRPDSHILAFAAHWGPLGICRHRKSWTHSLAERSIVNVRKVCAPLGADKSKGLEGWEPLDIWREYSRDARAIALEAIELKNNRTRAKDRVSPLFARVAEWVRTAATPLATFEDRDDQLPWPCGFGAAFGVSGVHQILALQLLGIVAGGRELAQCSHCGLPFVVTGHREGARRFCPSCIEESVPLRYASRDYRVRHKPKAGL